MALGFSTGVFHKLPIGLKERITIIRDIGCRAVELGCVKMHTFDSGELEALSPLDLAGFDYVSLHAPKFDYGDEGTERIFEKIRKLNEVRSLDLVVVHPDTITDIAVFENCSFNVGLENMDNRKSSCKTPDELAALLATNKNFSCVLDVNHAYSNDPSMKLAAEFYEKLGPRIGQIHLSGYAGYHEPLFMTQQKEIMRAIQNTHVPIIVESILTPENIGEELEYIQNAFKNLKRTT